MSLRGELKKSWKRSSELAALHSKETTYLKLYVWTHFCPGGEEDGIAFAIAESEEEAKKLVTENGEWSVWGWGDLEVRDLSKCGYFTYGG